MVLQPEQVFGVGQEAPGGLPLTVIGIGYLGLTHAVCMADLGHDVLAIDIDQDRVAMASQGEMPFFEPGLGALLRKNLDAGRLRLTSSFAEIGTFGAAHFLCVGTPQASADGRADLQHVHAAVDALAPHLTRPCLVVGKSTVPVGTARDESAGARRSDGARGHRRQLAREVGDGAGRGVQTE